MSLILHLETSTTVCSVAVSIDGKLSALKELNAGYSHAENLTDFCSEVLAQSKITFNDLAAVAVSKGPGSYTGLRIGVSAAKGFCYALDIPLISINTLQHLALQVSQKNELKDALYCSMLDARRMEVYCALFDAQNNEVSATEAKIIDATSFAEILQHQKIIFFGDGAAKCKSLLEPNPNALFLDDVFPSAQDMISLAEKKFAAQEFENTAYFEPYYLKDFLVGGKQS